MSRIPTPATVEAAPAASQPRLDGAKKQLGVRAAGYGDAQIVEIVRHVARSTWTNYINEVAKTEIDFPVIAARKAAA